MGGVTTWHPPTRRDLEARVGVESVEELQSERARLVAELAPLKAKYGPGGTWDAKRKAYRSAIAREYADEIGQAPHPAFPLRRGKPASETELERLAAGDDRMRRLLRMAEREMVRYLVLETQVQDVTERINRDQALIRYAAMEPRA